MTKKINTFFDLLNKTSGSALVLVVMLIAMLAFIPIGTELVKVAHKNIKLQLNTTVQADNVARAGLVDAISWFKRQASQPVGSNNLGSAYPDASFYPRTSTDSATSATIDENIGLVKEYELGESNSLWARYEVIRQSTNNVTSPSMDNSHAVHDITGKRVEGFSAGEGLAWYIESVGYVYRQKNANVAYNVLPNEIVAKSRVATEIRRLAFSLPSNAAVIITGRNNGSVGANCRVTGGSAVGAAFYTGSGGTWTNTTGSAGNIVDISTRTSIDQFALFGVTTYDLQLMSDYNVTSASALPADYPSMALVYINGNATFNSSRPLRGGGVLYVNGNLTADNTSNTLFSGLIFVNGNATINGPALISGSLVVTGSLTMTATTDMAEVQYDASILSTVRSQVGQYRENKSAYYVFSAMK